MAKNRSDVSCYASRFGAGWIAGDAYLAENMCSRKGRAEGNELAPFFWREPYWIKEFLKQKRLAAELLEEFEMQSIIAALRHKDAKNIYSFGAKSVLRPLIQKEQNRLNVQREVGEGATAPEPVDIYKAPRKPFGAKRSLIQTLRDLENEKDKDTSQ